MRPRRSEVQAQIRSRVGQASETGQIAGCSATDAAKYKNIIFYRHLNLNNTGFSCSRRDRKPGPKFYFMALHWRFRCVAQNCHDIVLIS